MSTLDLVRVSSGDLLFSARSTAAIKALLGGARVDVSGQLRFTQGQLTEAQFRNSLEAVFGKGTAQGIVDGKWTPGAGLELKAEQLKVVFGSVQLDSASNQLTIKPGGKVDASLKGTIAATLGKGVQLSSTNTLEFVDSTFQSASLANQLHQEFGDGGSIDAELNATITREGIESARLVASVKTLLGAGSVNTASGSLTFEKGQLTEAQFKNSLEAVLGETEVQGIVDGKWTPGEGLELKVEQLKVVFGAIQLDSASNQLTIKPDGKVDASLKGTIAATLGKGVQISSRNAIEFRDSAFVSAVLDSSLHLPIGDIGSIDAELKSTITSEGLQSAELVAAFKTLLNGAQLTGSTDVSITLENHSLTSARFKTAVATLFGEGSVSGDLDAQWTSSTGEWLLASQFKGVWDAVEINAGGTLRVKEGRVDGDLQAKIHATLGTATTLSSDNTVVFKNGAFVSAALKESLSHKFGANGSLNATFEATVTHEGIEQASLFAAAKSLVGKVQFDSATKVTFKNEHLDEVTASLSVLAGTRVQTSARGEITLDGQGRFKSQRFSADTKTVIGSTTIGAGGSWNYDAGQPGVAEFKASARRLLGDRASIESSGSVRFNGTGLKPAHVQAALTLKGAQGVDVTGAIVYEDGKLTAQLSVAAIQRLKVLSGNEGSIQIQENGTVEIKDGRIDRAEVGALLSVATSKKLNLTADGKLVYQDGKPLEGEMSAQLEAVWGQTTLNASGKLTLKDGQLAIADGSTLSAQFAGASVDATAGITFVDKDTTQLDIGAKSLGGQLDATGSLILEKGRIQSGSLSTNLVVGGDGEPSYQLRGLVAIKNWSESSKDAKVDANFRLKTEVLSFASGITASVVVGPAPAKGEDAELRKRVAKDTGVTYRQWSGTFKAFAEVGATANLSASGVPITLGVRSRGETRLQATAVTVSPPGQTQPGFFTVLRGPTSADAVLRMSPGESWQDSADRTFLVGGNVKVGWTIPGGDVSLGGDLSYTVMANVRRKVLCTRAGVVRVEISRGEGAATVTTLSVGATLEVGDQLKNVGSKVLGQILEKAKPLLEEAGKVQFTNEWTNSTQDTVFYAFEFDLADFEACLALTHLLNDNFVAAQGAARSAVGIRLLRATREFVTTQIDDAKLVALGLDAQKWSQWVSTNNASIIDGKLTFEEVMHGDTRGKRLLPWNGKWTSQIKLVHRQTTPIALGETDAEDFGKVSSVIGLGRPFEMGDARTMSNFVTLHIIAYDKKASLADVRGYVGATMALLDVLRVPAAQRGTLGEFSLALDADKVPEKKGPFDSRFGEGILGIQALVSPSGLVHILKQSPEACRNAYLHVAGRARNRLPLVVAPWGIARRLANAQNLEVRSNEDGSFEFLDPKSGALRLTLTGEEMTKLQNQIIESVPRVAGLSINSHETSAVLATGGTWQGTKRPSKWFSIDRTDALWGRTLLGRAGAFADAIQKARAVAEPILAGDPSIEVDTEAVYDRLDTLFQKAAAPNLMARLALVGLAGDGVYLRGGLGVAPEAIRQMQAMGFTSAPNAKGADVSFVVGALPVLPELASTFENLDDTTGAWMDRTQAEIDFA